MTEEEEEAYIAILEAENQRLRRILRLRLSQEKVKTSKKSSWETSLTFKWVNRLIFETTTVIASLHRRFLSFRFNHNF